MINFENPTDLLLALAERFDRHAERNEQYLQHQSRDAALQLVASSEAWRAAADIIRDTVLTYTNSFV
jgi:predicted component of type VI protein secretion system